MKNQILLLFAICWFAAFVGLLVTFWLEPSFGRPNARQPMDKEF